MIRSILILALLFLLNLSAAAYHKPALMPMPAKVEFLPGKYKVPKGFKISYTGNVENTRVKHHVQLFLEYIRSEANRFVLKHSKEIAANGNLTFTVQRRGNLLLSEDESYSLKIDLRGAVIEAETDLGVINALQTLRQLLSKDQDGYYFPYVNIRDEPRFPWRGLLMDVCRHFMPVDVIKRNIRGMNFVKLNVFHWHLTEDQGFRVESKKFPKLHEMGSEGKYYTQEQIREVIQYADSFGIRVVPEFDMPGHSTSWFVGHPELAARKGKYQVSTTFGVQNAAMDPTRKEVYTFLDTFLTEMAKLFPDPYMHIGGDEVNPKVWDSEPHIVEYKALNGFHSNEALQAYFNREIYTILTRNKKKMVGWDEILQPQLGGGHILIQSWRGKEAMYEAAKSGYQSILSQGYYIDLAQPSSFHYLNDPIPPESKISEDVLKNILGGEATMWAELVDERTVDSRIWPRTAAIAERLWSPVEIRDVENMYTRLEEISWELEYYDLRHHQAQNEILDEMVNHDDPISIKHMIDFIEPIQGYARHRSHPYTTKTPLNRIPDAAVPDPLHARDFYYHVQKVLSNRDSGDVNLLEAKAILDTIVLSYDQFLHLESHGESWQEDKMIFGNLVEAAKIGLEALGKHREKMTVEQEWKEEQLIILDALNQPTAECELAIHDGLVELINKLPVQR